LVFIAILLLLVARAYYSLAAHYGKMPFLYAILGIVIYGVSTLSINVFLIIIFNINYEWITFATYPVGLLACWLIYITLRKSWLKATLKATSADSPTSLDSDLIKDDGAN
jgi:hypothetical protein